MRDWLILPHRMTFGQMLAETSLKANVREAEILGPRRDKRVSWPRQDLMLVMFERGLSYCEIGRLFNRTHASAMHGVAEAALRRNQPAAKPPRPPRRAPQPVKRMRRSRLVLVPLTSTTPADSNAAFSAAMRRAHGERASY